jgi:hypothetical protein
LLIKTRVINSFLAIFVVGAAMWVKRRKCKQCLGNYPNVHEKTIGPDKPDKPIEGRRTKIGGSTRTAAL